MRTCYVKYDKKKGKACMKIKRILSAVLFAVMTIGVFSYTASAEDAAAVTHAYSNVVNATVDHKDNATYEQGVNVDGKRTIKIVPNPSGEKAGSAVALDSWDLGKRGIDLTKHKFITIEYKYEAENQVDSSMRLVLMGRTLTGSITIESNEKISAGAWNIASFNIPQDQITAKLKDGETSLYQCHFYPFGTVAAKELSANDVIYIGNITFTATDPEPNREYTVEFDGNGATGGTAPMSFSLYPGSEFTFPECTYTRGDIAFLGWKSSATSTKIYKPGETATSGAANVKYLAAWDIKEESQTPSEAAESVTLAYSGILNAIVNSKDTCTADKGVDSDGRKAARITPKPEGADASNSVALDSWDLAGRGIDLTKHKFITVSYKYEASENPVDSRMKFVLMGRTLTGSVTVESNESIVSDKWATATFNISQTAMKSKLKSGERTLGQAHFFPYGSVPAAELSSNDVMYIESVTFTSADPNPGRKYTVEFAGGGATGGTAPAKLTLNAGDEYTFPECTFTMGDAEFSGWMSASNTKEIHMPGEKATADTVDTVYIAMWDAKKQSDDVKVLDYRTYCGGVIDGSKVPDATLAFDTKATVDGIYAVMAKPNPKAEIKYFGFDGWEYAKAEVDMREYKYAAVLYKFDTAKEHDDLHVVLRPLGCFTKTTMAMSTNALVYGKWDLAVFDFSEYAADVSEEKPILRQLHVLPFQEGKISELDEGDAFYLSKIIFFKEKPEALHAHSAFISGYSDGTFRPNYTMTRAQACTVVTRLLTSEASIKGVYESKFADVKKGDWYYDNVAYLENKGYLKSYSGLFEPNKPITRAEFAELVYNVGLIEATEGKSVTFTDVTEAHPRYAAIMAAASAGIVSGYADGMFLPDRTITRAQVVKMINNAYGKNLYKNDYIARFDSALLYSDVPSDFWAYVDITEASVPHGTYRQSEKGEEWFYMATPSVPVDYAGAKAKLAEVDKLSEERISAIRSTETKVEVTGTKYYVSADGSDDNDGKSTEKAWKTLAKVNSAKLTRGDGVFFRRGDTFRGKIVAAQGITYSAYGEGEKPVITASESNGADESKWTLVEGSTGVWKYADTTYDIGGLVVNRGDGKGDKLVEKTTKYYNSETLTYFNTKNGDSAFDVAKDLPDMHVFSDIKSTEVRKEKGDVYFRCDEGNPGKIFESIEFITGGGHVITANYDVTVNNLKVVYGALHGIGAGSVNNLTVENCEIGWIGGGLEGVKKIAGTSMYEPGRYGNGVEIYGSCDNYTIKNCYVYKCFDAGITHQFKGEGGAATEKNVLFADNIIENCCYNIEYFMGGSSNQSTRLLQNIVYENNILRNAGYAFGRTNPTNAAHIKGWDSENMATDFYIRNNIFDRSYGDLLHIGAGSLGWLPKLSGNTYLQYEGAMLGHLGQLPTTAYKYDSAAGSVLYSVFTEYGPGLYFLQK